MATPFPPAPGKRTLASILSAVAVFIAVTPFLALLAWPLFSLYVSNNDLFLLLPATAAIALALAVSGLLLLKSIRERTWPFAVAVVLLGFNLGSALLASLAWFGSMTCSGGYSGPCFTPLVFCGGGLFLDITAIVLVAVGLFMLRRPPVPAYPFPPPWPPAWPPP